MKQPHFFSDSEQTVITFILKNPDKFKHATVKELAAITFTSSSTVIRLYQKLDFKKYSDFKLAFFSDLENRKFSTETIDSNLPFKKGDDFQTITENMGLLSINAIEDTLSLIDEHLYQKAIDMLYSTKYIDIYGVGSNISLAFDFKTNLRRIGRIVNTYLNRQEAIINAVSSDEEHAAIIISYTGETPETIEYCRLLKQTHTPMICITNIGNNTISDLSDISLKMASKEKMFSKIGSFSSKLSIVMILDLLYAGIFAKDYNSNLEMILKKRRLTSPFHTGAASVLED